MATTQTSRTDGRKLDRRISRGASSRELPGAELQLVAILLVISLAVVTAWVPGRWPDAVVHTGFFLIAILAAARVAFLGAPVPVNWLQVPFAAAVVLGLAQLATNRTVYRFQTWLAVLGWLSLLFAFSVAYQVFTNPALRRGLRVFAIYFGGFIGIWAILQLFSAGEQILWVYTPPQGAGMGPYLNYDHYSAFIELLLPIALWEAVIDRRRAVQYGCMAAIMYASVIAGTSRAGSVLVNLELAAVLIPALSRGVMVQRTTRGGVPLRIGLLSLVFTAVVGWDALLQRFQAKDPLAGRREMWLGGLAMIRDHPWLGVGLGTWITAYPRYALFDLGALVNAAHSDWLQWAGEGGIPFAALFVVLAGRALYLCLKMPWGAGVFFVLLHCLVDFPLQKTSIILWTAVLLGALEAGRHREGAFSG